MSEKTMISVKHLTKKFGDVSVLKDINLEIKEKKLSALSARQAAVKAQS